MTYLFLSAILLLSATFAIYNNFTLRFLNVLLLPIVFTAYTLSIRYSDWKYMNVTYLLKIVGKLYPKSLGAIPKLFVFIHGLVKAKLRSENVRLHQTNNWRTYCWSTIAWYNPFCYLLLLMLYLVIT